MSTIADQLVNISTTKSLIRDAIVSQGVAVPDTTPFRQYADKIAQIEGGGESSGETATEWVRPAGRPDVPVLNDNEIYMLYGVSPTGPNDFAITLTCTGSTYYYVDWGDGFITKDPVVNGIMASNVYFYDELDIVPDVDGIKWVWIKFYVSAGSFTGINLNVRPATRPAASTSNIFVPQVYEIYIQAPNVSSFPFPSVIYTKYRLLDIFKYFGTNKITTFSYFLQESRNLKVLEIDTSTGTNFSYFLYYCVSFNGELNINTSNGTNFLYFLSYNHAFNQLLNIDTSKGTDFQNFFYNNYAFNQPLNIDTSSGKKFTYFFYGNYSFNQPLNINTSSATTIDYFMQNVGSYSHSITVDLASATTAIGTSFIGTSSHALTGLRLLNMGSVHNSIVISNSSLTASALEDLFNDLYDRTPNTSGGITITGVAGASTLTAAQRLIATNKNWTITG